MKNDKNPKKPVEARSMIFKIILKCYNSIRESNEKIISDGDFFLTKELSRDTVNSLKYIVYNINKRFGILQHYTRDTLMRKTELFTIIF